VRARGFHEQTRQLRLREGASEDVAFELVAEPQPAAHDPAAPDEAEDVAVAQLLPGQAAYTAQLDGERTSGRVRGLIGLSMGGASLAVGIVTGVLSWSQTSDIKPHCDSDHACDAAQRDALQRANTLGNVANILVPVGVIGIAYGLYELLTLPAAAPSRSSAALRLELAPDAIVLRGVL
jgi:hypothetical protein